MLFFACVTVAAALGLCTLGCRDDGLLAHWPLTEDGGDASGCGRHGVLHGVRSERLEGEPCSWFDGRRSWFEAPADAAPRLGTDDFTISMSLRLADEATEAQGSILSHYDPARRRGVVLSLLRLTGVSNSQPNWQNLQFGIDDGRTDPDWTSHGRPGDCIVPFSMAVWRGSLYVGTLQAGADGRGRVFRLVQGSTWEDCGAPDLCNMVCSLAVYRGRLYAGVTRYPMQDSSVDLPGNPAPGGRVFRYDGGRRWTLCGTLANAQTGTSETVGGMAVFAGRLYATGWKAEGHGLYRYEGRKRWTYCGNPGKRVLNPFVFEGALHMVSYDEPTVFRYDPDGRWTEVGRAISEMQGQGQTYSFASVDGAMMVSSWPRAHVYRQAGEGAWDDCGRVGDDLETMPLVVYNGKLYTGVLPAGRVYRWEGGQDWTPFGRQLDTGTGVYRRVWSMAVFLGRLFCGTLPSGGVWSIEAGRSVTHDRDLGRGWKHIAAVRSGGLLKLYVNGKRVATGAGFAAERLDVDADAPLRIGAGPNGFFHGAIRDVRLYGRALSPGAVAREAR